MILAIRGYVRFPALSPHAPKCYSNVTEIVLQYRKSNGSDDEFGDHLIVRDVLHLFFQINLECGEY